MKRRSKSDPAILFDLDGTLLDTAPDMVGALNALRREEGLAPLPYDLVRSAVSHGAARVVKTGFPDAAWQKSFFLTLRGHAIEGCLADPRWGGNRDGVIWNWLGYPGAAS